MQEHVNFEMGGVAQPKEQRGFVKTISARGKTLLIRTRLPRSMRRRWMRLKSVEANALRCPKPRTIGRLIAAHPTKLRARPDGGSAFKKAFKEALLRQHKLHWQTYPSTPKMNAHNERFNRMIQEEYIDYHVDELVDPHALTRDVDPEMLNYVRSLC